MPSAGPTGSAPDSSALQGSVEIDRAKMYIDSVPVRRFAAHVRAGRCRLRGISASAVCIAAILLAFQAPAAFPQSGGADPAPRKPDPPLGSKSAAFAKNVGMYLYYKSMPGSEDKALKALEELKALETCNWKGIAELLNKTFLGFRKSQGKYRNKLEEKVDGLSVEYLLDLPRGYNPRKAWPLAIALHGGGAGSGDAGEAMSTFGSLMGPKGAIVAAPLAPELIDGAWNCPRGFRVVRQLIKEISETWHVDGNRVYIGGHSMGGYGSYFEAVWWPDRFAAALSSAGGITAGSVCDFENLYNTPLYVIHGTEDATQAPIEFVRAADKAVSLLGLKPRFYSYVEIPGEGHSFPDKWRRDAADAMWKHERDPYPKKVVCVCPNYWSSEPSRAMGNEAGSRSFWVEIIERSGADFNSPAKAIAEWGKEPNTIHVTTPPVRRAKHKEARDVNVSIQELPSTAVRIGICISEDFADLSKPVKIFLNGAPVFNGLVNRSADFLVENLCATGDLAMPFSARVVIKTR